MIRLGIALVVAVVITSFVPVTDEFYQHVRIWGHVVLGLAFGVGLVLVLLSAAPSTKDRSDG